MPETPAFLDRGRPDVPDIVVPGGVTPFHLAGRPVRGRLVRLGRLADALLSRHDTVPAVSALGGKALALVAALSTALKFQGSFSLQIKGDGPLSLLLADCTDTGALRFYVREDQEALDKLLAGNPHPTDRDLTGSGYLALTVDQGPEMDRHQGIVEISGNNLSDMAAHYFETSEQHACWLMLAARHTPEGWRAGALILERIAGTGGTHRNSDVSEALDELGEDAWDTAVVLARTLTEDELLDESLPPETVLHRLFHEEELRVGTSRALAYGCRCSRAKLADVLERFPGDDLDHMAEDGQITMKCEFCNVDFHFRRDEVGRHPPEQ
ncbi:Hsp33 family molecular chaperone HslO [Acetobacter oeni]|uniref:33 kDa chaperonin n=1 Tax=Acetobacter oeni TaxID=304077 RepID=A0A511XLB9_9PROT|nr:Hsp33 family molecular chaperone HslO [Acetobacter oeni]MBB3883508.1 molecular chaperone Hsp33 [Acetobacter oeni]NHO19548.1 Hsp33 family molecular chaperone HslO [Acetobacter oeni]GBR03174.1 heat shock protein Hsp33 [Acetobacter oeni LMG 21952]GEN63729.1 33 kDa chaperonin [Acetobacter oeni]